jgi:hypothetical protein
MNTAFNFDSFKNIEGDKGGGRGKGGRNDPNIVCKYELKKYIDRGNMHNLKLL